jgi:hypothetical protein
LTLSDAEPIVDGSMQCAPTSPFAFLLVIARGRLR